MTTSWDAAKRYDPPSTPKYYNWSWPQRWPVAPIPKCAWIFSYRLVLKKTFRTMFCGMGGHKWHITTRIRHSPSGIQSEFWCELCYYRKEEFKSMKITPDHQPVTAMFAGAGMERWGQK
jgi:hypothetical protein